MQNLKPLDVTVNTCYMVTLTLELMLRYIEGELAKERAHIQKEKKQKYNYFLDYTKKALYYADKLTDDIFEVDAPNNYANIQTWQEESNELARLILLYADKSTTKENIDIVFKTLRELKGEDIITDETLDYFRLKTL